MMRFWVFALAAWLLAVAGPADAARGGGGSSQFMELIDETDLPDQDTGEPLSLCHLITKWHVLFIPLWYGSDGYALATDRCDTDSYYPLDAKRFRALQSGGALGADLPAEPRLSALQTATPYLWGGLILLLTLLKLATRRKSKAGIGSLSPDQADFLARVIETTCRAAGADGKIEEREVAVICGIVEHFTTNQVDPARVRAMIEKVSREAVPRDLGELGSGLSDQGREQLLRVAMTVIGKAGMAEGTPGKGFVDRLAMALTIDTTRRDAIARTI